MASEVYDITISNGMKVSVELETSPVVLKLHIVFPGSGSFEVVATPAPRALECARGFPATRGAGRATKLSHYLKAGCGLVWRVPTRCRSRLRVKKRRMFLRTLRGSRRWML